MAYYCQSKIMTSLTIYDSLPTPFCSFEHAYEATNVWAQSEPLLIVHANFIFHWFPSNLMFFGSVGESPQSKVTSCGMHGNGRHNYHMCWCVQSGMMANVSIFVSLCKNLKMNLNHLSFDHSTKFIPLVSMKYERMLDGDKDNM